MKQLVSVNLTTRTATDWTPPELTFGESLTLALRLFKNSEGTAISAPLDVSSLKASIGRVDARPKGGEFAIKIGTAPADTTNTTAALTFNAAASSLADKLNAVDAHTAYGEARVVYCNGSWLMFFGDQSVEVPLEVVNNGLWPVSFGRINAWQIDGKWVHELRLTQAPVAFTSGHDLVLPPAPEITRIQAGGTDPSGTYFWNEIQQLYVPQEFLGSYIIKRGYAKTAQLSREDGTDAIQTALQVLGADCFTVTLPLSNKPTIEFIGDYAGLPQDLLVAEVKQAPVGDLTFTITLDRAELAAMLRSTESVTLPLEIRINGTDDGGFSGEFAFTLDVTVKRPVAFPDLEAVPAIEWLRPASPKTYIPFGADNILTGQHYYPATVGDGASSSFVIAHGLDSDAVFVFARENVSGGRQLIAGTDFSATIDNADQVTVAALTGAPDTDAWTIIVMSAQTVAAWATGLTVTVPQVVAGGGYPSLTDFMDDIGSRVTTLEEILPSTGPAATASAQASGIEIALPKTKEALFFRGDAAKAFGTDGVDVTVLGRAPLMLPAIHVASATSYTTGDLPAVAAGSVWQNNSGAALEFGRGIYGGKVADGGFFGSDGRVLYAVEHAGTTKSYFPTGFDRELWRIFINDKMLRLNRTLDVQFGLALQLLAATSNAQWLLVIEKGTAPEDTTPSTPAANLQNVVWDAEPILSQRIIITGNQQTHSFGTRIKRSLVSLADTITMDTLLYGVWEGADSLAPDSANFALRARLIQFDTENALASDARGWIASEIIGAKDGEDPKATIS